MIVQPDGGQIATLMQGFRRAFESTFLRDKAAKHSKAKARCIAILDWLFTHFLSSSA